MAVFTRNGGKARNEGGGGSFIMGDRKFLKSLDIVGC